MPLNDANFHLKVNMLKYKETNKKGEIKRFSWVTDLPLDRDTVTLIMRAGRRRWAIENETFKALKDWDVYNFEHNYGHGKKNLAVVLPMLAMLSLLIDQTQQHCCSLVQKALKYQKRKLYFWEKMNRLFLEYRIRDWRPSISPCRGELTRCQTGRYVPYSDHNRLSRHARQSSALHRSYRYQAAA